MDKSRSSSSSSSGKKSDNLNDAVPRKALGKQVLVIGAGISGVGAAKKLQEHGFQVTVLESQDRIGGRLKTNRDFGFAFDEGASWIHGVDGNPIIQLAKDAGLTTVPCDEDSILSYDEGGRLRSEEEHSAVDVEFEDEIYDSIVEHASKDLSFAQVFKNLHPDKAKDRLWIYVLSAYMTFNLGDVNKLSSLDYDQEEKFGVEEALVTNGYDSIPKFLAKDLDVHLNQRVSKVEYSGDKIFVTHNGTVTSADFVLVTVPLGVLKSGRVEFSPSLPEYKITAIQTVPLNCINKFLLLWDECFWDDEFYISYTPERTDIFNYFVNLKHHLPHLNALITYAYADEAIYTETLTDEQVLEHIMKHLRDIYGPETPAPKTMYRTFWNSDENAYGVYTYPGLGSSPKFFDDLAKSVDDKVFFAGEHTSKKYFSTVHGAYLSGIREADKIIKIGAASN